MIMMARAMDYSELVEKLKGKKVIIMTCNTCARLCDGIGGDQSASKLAEVLRADNIHVSKVLSTSACCLEKKVLGKFEGSVSEEADIILALTCDMGAVSTGRVFGMPVLNPIVTLGPGILDLDGRLLIPSDGGLSEVSNFIEKNGFGKGPFA